MQNIKSYILRNGMENKAPQEKGAGDKTATQKRPLKAKFKTVFVSGTDFAVERTTQKTSQMLVFLVSKQQYYLKKGDGTIVPLDTTEMAKFTSGVKDAIELVDENGNRPTWIGELPVTQAKRAQMFNLVNCRMLYPYICEGIVTMGIYRSQNQEPASTQAYSLIKGSDYETVTRLFRMIEKYAGHEAALDDLNQSRGIMSLVRVDYTNKSTLDVLLEHMAWDGVEEIVRMSCLSDNKFIPQHNNMAKIFNRTDPNAGCWYYKPLAVTEFEPKALAEYLYCAPLEQGYNGNVPDFLELWIRNLNLQKALYGEVREKFPERLKEQTRLMDVLFDNRWTSTAAKAIRKMSKLNAANGTYTIYMPQTAEEMYAAEKELGVSVITPASGIEDQSGCVFLVKENGDGGKLIARIAVSLPDFNIVSVVGKRYRDVPDDVSKCVEAWIETVKEDYVC